MASFVPSSHTLPPPSDPVALPFEAVLGGDVSVRRAEGWPAYLFLVGNFANLNSRSGNSSDELATGIRRFYPGLAMAGSADAGKIALFQEVGLYLKQARSSSESETIAPSTLDRLKGRLSAVCGSLDAKEKWALNRFGSETGDLLPAAHARRTTAIGLNWSRLCGA